MSDSKTLKTAFLLLLFPLFLVAQNTNSPYSRYGYGTLEQPALGKSKGMGGVGIGLRENNAINPANPASYSAIDTMTMLFDFGATASMSLYQQGTSSMGTPNGGLDYVAMKVPLKSWWGVAAGLRPYSKVGYSYSQTGTLSNDVDYTDTYAGTGGLNVFFLGTSVALWKNLAIGLNYNYYNGLVTQSSLTDFTPTTYNDISVTEYWYLKGSGLDLGLQYKQRLSKLSHIIAGATYSFQTPLTNKVYVLNVATDTVYTDTKSRFDMPETLGFGLSWVYDDRLTVAVDYKHQLWSKAAFNGAVDSLTDRTRLGLGIEYLPSYATTRYFEAVKYRFGCYYSNSYIGNDVGDLRNVGLTFGFGLPLRNTHSPMNVPALNISFEIGKEIPPNSSMLSETYFKVSLDMTFNEEWFFKRKL